MSYNAHDGPHNKKMSGLLRFQVLAGSTQPVPGSATPTQHHPYFLGSMLEHQPERVAYPDLPASHIFQAPIATWCSISFCWFLYHHSDSNAKHLRTQLPALSPGSRTAQHIAPSIFVNSEYFWSSNFGFNLQSSVTFKDHSYEVETRDLPCSPK